MLQFQNVPVNFTKGLETKDDELLADGNDAMENVDMSSKGTPEKRYGFQKYPAVAKYDVGVEGLTETSYSVPEVIEAGPRGNKTVVSDKSGPYIFSRETQSYLPISLATGTSINTGYPLASAESKGEIYTDQNESFEGETAWAESSEFKVFAYDGSLLVRRKSDDSVILPVSQGFKLEACCFTVLDDVIYFSYFVVSGNYNIGKINSSGKVEFIQTLDSSISFFVSESRDYQSLNNDGEFLYAVRWLPTTESEVIKVYKINVATEAVSTYLHTVSTDNDQRNKPIDIAASENYVCVGFFTYIDATSQGRFNLLVLDKDMTLNASYQYDLNERQDGHVFMTLDDQERCWVLIGAKSRLDITTTTSKGNEDGVNMLIDPSDGNQSFPFVSGNFFPMSRPQVIGEKSYFLARWRNDEEEDSVFYDYGAVCSDSEASIRNAFSLHAKGAGFPVTSNAYSPFLIPSSFYFDESFYIKTGLGRSRELGISLDRNEVGGFVEDVDTTYFPGALVSVFDGQSLFPAGFYSRPKIVNSSTSAGSVPAEDYDYIAIFTKKDANGNVYRSRESNKFEITLGSSLDVTLEIGLYGLNQQLSGELYRKLRTETVYRFVKNFSSDSVVDDVADISENKTLYTTGDILESEQPPALKDMASHQNRLFGVSLDNKVYFTKTGVRGEAFEFNEFFTINIDENQGRRAQDLTAVAGLDNKLIVFKKNSIFAIFGNGPDNTGANNDFSQPELITTDVGCEAPRSTVLNSSGVYFKGEKGIYQLSRGLQLSFPGADVDRFRSLTITSAVLLEASNRVVFTTIEGTALVHNYNRETWTTYTNTPAVSAFMSNGKFLYFRSDATAWEEQADFSDDGAFITQKITTNWLKVAGIQGFQRAQRILLLGKYRGDHTMKVRVYYDYEDYFWDEYTLTPIDADYNQDVKPSLPDYQDGVNNGVFQWNIHLKKQKCQALKVEIFDEERGGTPTEAFSLSNMTIKVGLKKGLFKGSDKKAV